MRKLLIACLLLVCSLPSLQAQNLDNETAKALGYIQQGYLNYGYERLRKAASLNKVAAQYYLAVCSDWGIIVAEDESKAFELYRRVAERGLPDGMYQLAQCYLDGKGINRDPGLNSEWMERFNKRGGKMTLPDLSVIYNEGKKYTQNYALNPTGTVPNVAVTSAQPAAPVTVYVPTIVETAPAREPEVKKADRPEPKVEQSDVDQNIPSIASQNDKTFALIIANENYQEVAAVDNAISDGETFASYCKQTLGIPTSNVHLLKNATLNNIRREVRLLEQIATTYKGEAKFIVYYCGHGIPDEASRDAYILPTDGYVGDLATCYSLSNFYAQLGGMPSSQIVVFLDACFSGSQRGDGMLTAARGVAIKAKPASPKGNMVVLTASQGNETAYSYGEQHHGMFTYFLLKRLQQTGGDVSLGDLAAFVKDNVMKKSIVINGKLQTPTVLPSVEMQGKWEELKLR